MDQRLKLHEELCEALGSRHVYFQPPESLKMSYPAIVYSRKDINLIYANNEPYGHIFEYEVTVIDRDPDSEVVKRIAQLPRCLFDRHYSADNLNHDVFVISTC